MGTRHVQDVDLARVDVQAHHMVAHLGQAGARDQADIAGRRWLKTGVLMWGFGRLARADETLRPPVLSLARPMPPGLHPEGWLVSEKYDGVRAHWDGQQLRSRSGHRIALPQVLLAQLPSGQPLDGELWLGRGQFQSLMSLLQTADAAAPGWQHLRYMVFDWPGGPGRFDERIAALRARLHAPGEGPGPVEVVEQLSFETRVELRTTSASSGTTTRPSAACRAATGRRSLPGCAPTPT
jgi:DNA ligase-1